MYHQISDFHSVWAYEAEATLKILRALTNQSLSQKVTDDGRSLGFLAWHLTITLSEMLGQAGLSIEAPSHELPAPENAQEITDAYQRGAASVSEVVGNNWKDEDLTDKLPMYGETWTKSIVLNALVAHQIHHRGQMTVLMRQAGLRVPGVYGPAKEEWKEMGIPALP